MRAKVFALALLACVAVTAYVLLQMRAGKETGRTATHETGNVSEPLPEPPPAAEPERAPEPPTPPAAEDAPPPLSRIDPPPAGAVVGVVRSTRGEPIFDAEVRITPLDGSPATATRPDAQGFVRIDGLAPGSYRLDASHRDYAPRSFAFVVPERGGAGPLDIVLTEGGALRVRVLGAFGAGLPEKDVRISLEDRAKASGGRTDARGEILFEHLPPGQYWVRLPSDKNAAEQLRTATVEPGKAVEVVFDTSCGLVGTLEGPDGRPLAGAIVRLTPAEFGPEGYRAVQATSNEEGRFEISGFAPGAQRVNVQVLPRREEGRPAEPGYVASLPVIEFLPGQVRTEVLRVPATVLGGRITRADTGEALGGSHVQVQAFGVELAEGKAPLRKGDHNMAWADENGRYRFTGLPAGHYELWVFSTSTRDLSPARRFVDFTAGGALDGIDFALPARQVGRVRLRVLEPDGTPATGVSFSVLLPDNIGMSLSPRQVGDGVYEVEVEAGPREVSLYRKGFTAEAVAVEVPAGGVVEREVRLTAQ